MLIEDSLKTFKPLEHSSKLIKHVPKSIKNEKINRELDFLVQHTLGTSL